jgi:hypothetical protein
MNIVIIPIIHKHISRMHNNLCVRLTETEYLSQDFMFIEDYPGLLYGEHRETRLLLVVTTSIIAI